MEGQLEHSQYGGQQGDTFYLQYGGLGAWAGARGKKIGGTLLTKERGKMPRLEKEEKFFWEDE